MGDPRWILLDLILIPLAFYLAFTQPWLFGGWGWLFLLGLSPNAHKTRW